MTREMTVDEETEVVGMLNAAIKFSVGVSLYMIDGSDIGMEVQTNGGRYALRGDCLFSVLKQYQVQRANRALYGD